MDEIQRTLIKAGRKDLAQEYFTRVASADAQAEPKISETDIPSTPEEIAASFKKAEHVANFTGRVSVPVEAQFYIAKGKVPVIHVRSFYDKKNIDRIINAEVTKAGPHILSSHNIDVESYKIASIKVASK